MRKFLILILFWIAPWSVLAVIFQLGFRPELGDLISLFSISEFRDLPERLVRSTAHPAPGIFSEPDSTAGIFIAGDSFGGIMNSAITAIWPARKWRYGFISNHQDLHWSPRRTLLADLQDSTKDFTGFRDVFLVEIEMQTDRARIDDPNLAQIQPFKSKKKPEKRWEQIRRESEIEWNDFVKFYGLRIVPQLIDESTNRWRLALPTALHPDAPVRLRNGDPIEKMTFYKLAELGFRTHRPHEFIVAAVSDYKLLDSLCEARGLRFHSVFVPDRTTVYAPWVIGEDPEDHRSFYEAHIAAVDSAGISHIDGVQILDSLHAAGETNLYWLHDIHWNAFAAMHFFERMVELADASNLPELRP